MATKLKKREIRGKDHVLVVMKAVAWDAQGRPSKVEMGYDDTVFAIEGGEQFFTAYVPEDMLEKHTRH